MMIINVYVSWPTERTISESYSTKRSRKLLLKTADLQMNVPKIFVQHYTIKANIAPKFKLKN